MAPYISSLILHFIIYCLTPCESLATWDEVSGLLPSTPPPLSLASVADDDGTPFEAASQGKVFTFSLLLTTLTVLHGLPHFVYSHTLSPFIDDTSAYGTV